MVFIQIERMADFNVNRGVYKRGDKEREKEKEEPKKKDVGDEIGKVRAPALAIASCAHGCRKRAIPA